MPYSRGGKGESLFARSGQIGKRFNNFSTTVNEGISKCSSLNSSIVTTKNNSSQFECSRKANVFPPQLGKAHTRPSSVEYSPRVLNSLSLRTSTELSSPNVYDIGGKDLSRYRNYGDAPKRSDHRGPNFPESDSKFDFSGSQKRFRTQTSNKFKGSEFIYTLRPFQNGRSISTERPSSTGRLHVQTRSEGCIFFSSIPSGISGESKVQMERENIPVSLFMVRPRTSTKSVYKTIKGTNSIDKNVRLIIFLDDILVLAPLRRKQCKLGIDFSVAAPRVSNQCEKISIPSVPTNSISGSRNRFNPNELELNSRENRKDNLSLSNIATEGKSEFKGADFISNCKSVGSSSISKNAKATDSGVKLRETFRVDDSFGETSETGVALVDSKSEAQQWKEHNPMLFSDSDFIRCFNERMGSLLPGSTGGGILECLGKKKPHKLSRTKSSTSSSFDICKNISLSKGNPSTIGQYNGTILPEENGGNKECQNVRSQQRYGNS